MHILKKIFLTLSFLILSFTAPAFAENSIKVKLDDEYINFDVQPQIINDRTMVPLRAIFEALGATVNWEPSTGTVTSSKGNTDISLALNSSKMYVNNSEVILDSPACAINGRIQNGCSSYYGKRQNISSRKGGERGL